MSGRLPLRRGYNQALEAMEVVEIAEARRLDDGKLRAAFQEHAQRDFQFQPCKRRT